MHHNIIHVDTHHKMLHYREQAYACAIGKNGMIAQADKREGDNKTPLGRYPLRYGFYREDKLTKPDTGLDMTPITRQMGWCDDVAHPSYNQLVALPFDASHETMWRTQDDCYDVVVVLGHNDNPPVAGMGSAIFMHVAKEGYSGTEGCVALAKHDLLALLALCDSDTMMEID